jgi:drug/metabolite transporter (DMT)-like permease
VGVALAVAAATVYAVYILAGTKVMQSVAPLAAAAVVICSTAAVYGGVVFVQGPVWPGTIAGWLSIAALSILCTVVAIALFFAGLER